jgi:hypothetical protein
MTLVAFINAFAELVVTITARTIRIPGAFVDAVYSDQVRAVIAALFLRGHCDRGSYDGKG